MQTRFGIGLMTAAALLVGTAMPVVAGGSKGPYTFALITKTNENPVFVLEKDEGVKKAKQLGVRLLTFTGKYDGDNASQVTAVENAISAGVNAIIIVPNDTRAIVAQIQEARKAGIIVVDYDSPLIPANAADATFATNNFAAGELIGEWAKGRLGPSAGKARIAMLDADTLMVSSDVQRDTGFLTGFGISVPNKKVWGSEKDSRVVGHQPTKGSASLGQSAMENMLERDPTINLVYTMNEQAAAGAAQALKTAGRAGDVLLVSVDGTCAGLDMVKNKALGATAMQFWLTMVDDSMDAAFRMLQTGEKPRPSPGLDYVDTGAKLATNQPMGEVPSIDANEALKLRGTMCAKNS